MGILPYLWSQNLFLDLGVLSIARIAPSAVQEHEFYFWGTGFQSSLGNSFYGASGRPSEVQVLYHSAGSFSSWRWGRKGCPSCKWIVQSAGGSLFSRGSSGPLLRGLRNSAEWKTQGHLCSVCVCGGGVLLYVGMLVRVWPAWFYILSVISLR